MADLTRRWWRARCTHGGTFYLPYQQHYSRADLERAYPRAGVFALKERRDPGLLFMNSLASRSATATKGSRTGA